VAVAAGLYHTVFLKSDGSLWGMGGDGSSELTNRGSVVVYVPTQIVSNGVANVVAGTYHTLFIKSDGSLWGIGRANSGQLGDGFHSDYSPSPEQIVPLARPILAAPVFATSNPGNAVTNIAAGSYYSMFVKSDGSLWAMGDNSGGQMGDGSLGMAMNPEQIATGVVGVSANHSQATPPPSPIRHTLFFKTNGSLWAMGHNSFGQLGDGSFASTNRPEQIVSNSVVAVAAGTAHSLFLKSNGSLWAMGYNLYGQLGDGTATIRFIPVQVVSSGVVAIAAGAYHSLFLKSDGSLWTMGWNGTGRLGDATLNSTNRPKQILSSGVVAISAGFSHSLFLKSDGTFWGMGDNSTAELGNGSNGSLSPMQLTGGAGSLSVRGTCLAGGNYFLLASTNLAQPLSQWSRILTNSISLRGTNNFSAIVTNAANSSADRQFFILQAQ
jgi:alpha-tubulin suppressor-like RCC1 family protein